MEERPGLFLFKKKYLNILFVLIFTNFFLLSGLSKYSFLCPNGTVFNQEYFICDWWFNFDCSEAENFYSLNEDIAAEREAATQALLNGQASYLSNTYSAAPPQVGLLKNH